jgi:hypothetical protein
MGLFDGGFFGGNGGSSTSTTTTSTAPWTGVQPYLRGGFKRAAELAEAPGPAYFPGSTVTPFAPETEQALQAMTSRARAGSPVTGAAQQEAVKTLGGGYLGPDTNPYLQSVFDAATDRVGRKLSSQFVDANRYGSEGHQRQLAQAYGDISADIGFQDYNAERARQMGMVGQARGLANVDYGDIDRLAMAGAAREELSDAQLRAQMARFQFGEDQPAKKLSDYMAAISGQPGGQVTSTQPVFRNRALSALGGAATGAGIAGQFGWDPLMLAGLGAGVGAY